jgi:hypothetical protein
MGSQAISFSDLGGIPAQPPARQQNRGIDFSDLGGIPASMPPAQAAVPSVPQTAMQRLFGAHPIDDALNVVGTHVKNLAAGPYHAFTDAPQDQQEAQEMGTTPGSGLAARTLGHIGLGAARMLVNPTLNAARTSIQQARVGNTGLGTSQSEYDAQGNYLPTAASSAMDAIPLAGPWARGIENDARKHGAVPALLGLGTDVAAPMAAGKAISLAGANPRLPDTLLRRPLTGVADTTIPGTITTPRLRYQAAQRLGVNLDAADATGSPVLQQVKNLNENSLFAAPTYGSAKAANLSAVDNATDSILNRMSPHDRTVGGTILQNDLRANQAGLQSNATAGFDSLPQGIPIPGLEEVGKTAQDIARENAAYQDLFPSLKPTKAMNVVGDVGGLGPKPPAPVRLSPFVDEGGKPIPSAVQASAPQAASFGTGQKLRSDLLDFTRNNPDIVQNQGNGFIQRLAGQTDDALTNASSSLTPAQLETFRQANAYWKDMKGTYDSPSSPYYSAVRPLGSGGVDPAKLSSGFGPQTPNFVADLQSRVSPEAMGAVQRGVAEEALGSAPGGGYNFSTFPRKFRSLPDDYAGELFGDHALRLNDLADTTHALNRDFNPSGSGRLNLKNAEMGEGGAAIGGVFLGHPGALLGTGIYHAAQYGTAKLMNSPGFVKWLMETPSAPALKTGIGNRLVNPLESGASLAAPVIGGGNSLRRLPQSIPAPAAIPPPAPPTRVASPPPPVPPYPSDRQTSSAASPDLMRRLTGGPPQTGLAALLASLRRNGDAE